MIGRLQRYWRRLQPSLTVLEIESHLAKFGSLAEKPKNSAAQLENDFRADTLFTVGEYGIDAQRFDTYRAQQRYQERFPKYFQEFGAEGVWNRKLLEHFISIDIIQPIPGGTYIDVAASNSPVSVILRETFGAAKAYRQDLRFPAGVHGDEIGSDAASVPLPDESVDGILMHNSWEHFEGDSDKQSLCECARLLRPGGRVCIIPLDIASTGYQITSPSEWERKAVAGKLPSFDPRLPVIVDNSARQRLIKVHSFESLREDVAETPELECTLHIVTNNHTHGFQRYFLSAQKRRR